MFFCIKHVQLWKKNSQDDHLKIPIKLAKIHTLGPNPYDLSKFHEFVKKNDDAILKLSQKGQSFKF